MSVVPKDSAYYYSTYNAQDKNPVSEAKPKIMILGGGPNRIGQVSSLTIAVYMQPLP